MGDYLITEYVATRPGDPYRLFPFGVIYKGGVKREITPALAAAFHLPHFKPAIKLGSHEETTPAGGHIVALEVREDGLYAIPELNDNGVEALTEGAYRYHSPEVIWSGGFEDPQTGKLIEGPLIIGDALLHMPHLGEAAALYSVVEAAGKEKQMSENFEVPKGLWDRFSAWLDKMTTEPAPKTEPPAVDPELMTALQTERDQYKARLDAIQAEKDQLEAERQQAEALRVVTELKAGIVADLQKQDQFGAYYIELAKAQEAADMLAGMSEEARGWCMRQFGALAMQIKESNLSAELGSTGSGNPDPRQALDAAVKARMAEKQIDYLTAVTQLASEKPELF